MRSLDPPRSGWMRAASWRKRASTIASERGGPASNSRTSHHGRTGSRRSRWDRSCRRGAVASRVVVGGGGGADVTSGARHGWSRLRCNRASCASQWFIERLREGAVFSPRAGTRHVAGTILAASGLFNTSCGASQLPDVQDLVVSVRRSTNVIGAWAAWRTPTLGAAVPPGRGRWTGIIVANRRRNAGT